MRSGPFCLNSMALEYLIKLSLATLIFPQIDWLTNSPTNLDLQIYFFCDILNDSFLIQMNGFVTRLSSTIDIVLTNHEALIGEMTTSPGSFDSDRIPVTFTIKSS